MFECLLRAVYHSAGAPGIYPLPAAIHRHARSLLGGHREYRREAPQFLFGNRNPDAKPAPARERGEGKLADSTMPI
ncbi:MAG: hypothetical protein OXU71_03800 [Gammaproteobacteria bacterium]|nr:hypothetical protein [Gammaproteobacteria bacterium]